MLSARPYSASGLSKAHERRESIGDVLDLLSERRELRWVGAGEVLQVRNEADDLVDHVLHRLRLPARHAERPIDLLLAFGESSYRPSSRFRSKSSWVICSSSGYTDPGDGRHHPCVIVSISSMISTPFFGALARIEKIQPRRPRFRCIIHRNARDMPGHGIR